MTRLSVALALSGLSPVAADAPNEVPAKLGAADAAEIYTFVLPAIDCHRTSDVKITTDEAALNEMLATALASPEEGDAAGLQVAAVNGAKLYEFVLAEHGKQAYCEFVHDHFGPAGSIANNLTRSAD